MKLNPIETVPDTDVLVWRADQKCWAIANGKQFRHWIGNPELAYTFWLPLPPKIPNE